MKQTSNAGTAKEVGKSGRRKRPKAPYKSYYEQQIAEDLEKREVVFVYEESQLQYWKEARRAFCDECGSKAVIEEHWYTPDFELYNGVIIEAKGRFTYKDQTKMLAVRRDHPTLDIRMLFMRDQRLTKKRDKKYSDWCKEHGFLFAFGMVPEEWTK